MQYKYYYYSREELLANEENANQRHLVTIASEAILMTIVMFALRKHIQKLTHAQNIHAHTEPTLSLTHTHTRPHACTRACARARIHTHHIHIYTLIFIYSMKCLMFYSLNLKTYTKCVCEVKKP